MQNIRYTKFIFHHHHEDTSILHTEAITSMTSEPDEVLLVDEVTVFVEVGGVVLLEDEDTFSILYSTRSKLSIVSRRASSTAFHWSIISDIGTRPPTSAGKMEAGMCSASLSKLE